MTGAALPYGIDITEIDGFDDLHHAKGILKEMQERTANLYHAEETCWIVNGSTAGILSAIMGLSLIHIYNIACKEPLFTGLIQNQEKYSRG